MNHTVLSGTVATRYHLIYLIQQAVDVQLKNFLEVVGQEKYVFMMIYSKNCSDCNQLAREFSTLHSFYMDPNSPRSDVVIASMNGDKNSYLCEQLQVKNFPEIFIFRPNDFRYPIDYTFKKDFETMKRYIQTYPVYIMNNEERKIERLRIEKNSKLKKRKKTKKVKVQKQKAKQYRHSKIKKKMAVSLEQLNNLQKKTKQVN